MGSGEADVNAGQRPLGGGRHRLVSSEESSVQLEGVWGAGNGAAGDGRTLSPGPSASALSPCLPPGSCPRRLIFMERVAGFPCSLTAAWLQPRDRRAGREVLVWKVGRGCAFTLRDWLGEVSAHQPSGCFSVCVTHPVGEDEVSPQAGSGQPQPGAHCRPVRAHGEWVPPCGQNVGQLISAFVLKVGLWAICFSFSPFLAQKSRILGSTRFSLSDVAVHTFLPNTTWKGRGGKWLLWRFWL